VGINDRRDGEDLIRVLEEEIIPIFYNRDADGLPIQWIDRMMNSIATLAARFSAHRMVVDYVQQAYLVAAGGLSSDMTVR
jgi:starch phosphorylase